MDNLGWHLATESNEYASALDHLQTSLEIQRNENYASPLDLLMTRWRIVTVLIEQQRFDEAKEELKELLGLTQTKRYLNKEGWVHYGKARLSARTKDIAEFDIAISEAKRIAVQTKNRYLLDKVRRLRLE